MFLGSYIINDFKRINKSEILKKVKESTRFTFSFTTLLIGSSIVCTLGLLLNSTAVVIGGMIISPLMWPLMQTSIGISYGRSIYIRRALLVLIVATLVGLLTAILITFVSPLKLVNSEILARTNPTLIDIVIAMVAGGVAALAVTQPKISESLAGVAIATSLMPPLCVSGIGLALLDTKIFWGGLLLYLTNIVSIIFISVVAFLWLGLKSNAEDEFQKRALSITAIILLVIAVPLFILLRQLSFGTVAYSKAEEVLTSEFSTISDKIFISGLNVDVSDDNIVTVEAEVLIPEDVQMSYENRQKILASLEKSLDRRVDLKLRLQSTISVLSKEDIVLNETKDALTNSFISKLAEIKPDLEVDRIEIYQNQADNNWIVSGVLIGDPSTNFVFSDQQKLENYIEEKTGTPVLLDLTIISRIRIKSDPNTLEEGIKQSVQEFIQNTNSDMRLESISVYPTFNDTVEENSVLPNTNPNTNPESMLSSVGLDLVAVLPSETYFDQNILNGLQNELESKYLAPFKITFELKRMDVYELDFINNYEFPDGDDQIDTQQSPQNDVITQAPSETSEQEVKYNIENNPAMMDTQQTDTNQ